MSVPNVYNEFLNEYSSIEAHSNYALFKVNRTANRFRFIRLEPNGRVNFYRFPNYNESGMTPSFNLFEDWIGNSDCDYPTVCGNYGGILLLNPQRDSFFVVVLVGILLVTSPCHKIGNPVLDVDQLPLCPAKIGIFTPFWSSRMSRTSILKPRTQKWI